MNISDDLRKSLLIGFQKTFGQHNGQAWETAIHVVDEVFATQPNYESRRHYFEASDGNYECEVCGEDKDEDFLRITVHFNDGDG